MLIFYYSALVIFFFVAIYEHFYTLDFYKGLSFSKIPKYLMTEQCY